MWLTWANVLTAARALLAVPCAWLAAGGHWTFAALLLSLAILTDLLDGPLARRLRQSSALGGLIDHATDAAFVTLLLAALAARDYLPWLLPLLVAASFLQYVADSRALQGRTLRTSWLGRGNGIGYFVLAALPVYRNALGLPWPTNALIDALAWLLVLTTLASMLDRFRVWRTAE
jgi:phosphatidylglycerophosphate synthase